MKHGLHSRIGWIRPLLLHLAACGAMLGVCALADDDDVTSRFCDQLRQRRLFGLAEGYCLDRLKNPAISSDYRAQLTLELSRTFVDHARFTTGRENADLIQRASEVIDELLAQEADQHMRPVLEFQRALVAARHGEFLRWDAELAPGDDRKIRKAEDTLLNAVRQFEELDRRLDRAGRDTGRIRGDDRDDLSRFELRKLGDHIHYEIGVAQLERARLFPSGARERAEALIEAERALGDVAGGVPGQELTWRGQLALAECLLFRGETRRVDSMLKTLQEDALDDDILDRVRSLETQLLMEQGRPDDALRLLIDYRRRRKSLPGELRYWKARAIIELWRLAGQKGDAELAANYMDQLLRHVERVELQIGGFWGYRSRMLVQLARESTRFGDRLALAIRRAESQYHDGDFEQALESYARAEQIAAAEDNRALAMQLGYTRASILIQAGQFEPAAEILQSLVERFPNEERAAEAHLLWGYCLGKRYELAPSTDRRAAYRQALEAHRTRFAARSTSADATWMLAHLCESGGEYHDALALYADVPPKHARAVDAQLGMARCYEAIVRQLRRDAIEPADPWEQEAVRRLNRFVAEFPPEPDPLTRAQSELCLRLARFYLNRSLPGYEQADRLLERVVSSVPSPEPDLSDEDQAEAAEQDGWHELVRAATQLRIVSLAGQRRLQEAEAFLRDLSDAGIDEMLSILDGLTQISANADETARRGLAELGLRAARKLDERRSVLTPAEATRLDRCFAEAYLATNQPTRAIEVYESMLKRDPRDSNLLRTVSRLLMECGTKDCLTRAKAHWQRVAQLEKQKQKGSTAWLDAQYHVALCSFRLKQYDDCRRTLSVIKILYPERGGPELRARFQDLQREVDLRAVR